MGGGDGVTVMYITSSVEVGVAVSGTGVRVSALAAVAFLPCSGRIGPQAPARSITSMTKGTIDICLDSFIRENMLVSK